MSTEPACYDSAILVRLENAVAALNAARVSLEDAMMDYSALREDALRTLLTRH